MTRSRIREREDRGRRNADKIPDRTAEALTSILVASSLVFSLLCLLVLHIDSRGKNLRAFCLSDVLAANMRGTRELFVSRGCSASFLQLDLFSSKTDKTKRGKKGKYSRD